MGQPNMNNFQTDLFHPYRRLWLELHYPGLSESMSNSNEGVMYISLQRKEDFMQKLIPWVFNLKAVTFLIYLDGQLA